MPVCSPIGVTVADTRPSKIDGQITRAGLPTGGDVPFIPALEKNRRGDDIIKKATILYGPRKGKRGFVNVYGRIWVKDRAHADVPDHWDVQEDHGRDYIRVSLNGEKIS